ncbi:unnamed protein product [Phytomonas sp. Hart1]|nr:unnamed protein product [Phytomonas sp. Hart1]|eukprot:CCW68939.1 unnamed protein product [Phytomonas sp. isolate Hart1]
MAFFRSTYDRRSEGSPCSIIEFELAQNKPSFSLTHTQGKRTTPSIFYLVSFYKVISLKYA